MEWKKSVDLFALSLLWMFLILSQAVAFPAPESSLGSAYSLDDYEQPQQPGLREIFEELERQGGLTGPIMPRSGSYYVLPNRQMARKSQRSSLRLRFGKRSLMTGERKGENPISWKGREIPDEVKLD